MDRSGPLKKTAAARSGQHPAVQAYRAKLESVDRGSTDATSELDRELQKFLDDLKTLPPPPPEPSGA